MRAYIVSETENGIDNIDGVYYLITEENAVIADRLHDCRMENYMIVSNLKFWLVNLGDKED